MSRTHRFTLALGVLTLGLLGVLWAHTDLTNDEVIILAGSLAPLIFLEVRGIEIRALPGDANEPPVTVTTSLTEALTVPLAIALDPAAAASLLLVSSMIASVGFSRRSSDSIGGSLSLALGSASLSALNLLAVGALGHLVVERLNSSSGKIGAAIVGVVAMQLLGMGGGVLLCVLSRRPLELSAELELVLLLPFMVVPAAILLVSLDSEEVDSIVPGMAVCIVFSEAVRRSYSRALELRRRDAERGDLLRMVLESTDEHRRALAARLHDGPLQEVLALKLRLEVEPTDPMDTAAIIDVLDRVAVDIRGEMRAAIPSRTADSDLELALVRDCDALRSTFPLGVEIEFDVRSSLDGHVSRVAYQIVHEALLNAQRHSGARYVRIRAVENAGVLELEIRDDGRGIAGGRLKTASAEGHIGVVTMRDRAHAIGGELVIDASEGGGVAVCARLPTSPRQASRAP